MLGWNRFILSCVLLACAPPMAAQQLLKDINAVPRICSSEPTGHDSRFVQIGSWFYFAATDEAHGRSLWKTDGTEAGTVRVKGFGIFNSPTDWVANLTKIGSRLFFTVRTDALGEELWVSDGTGAGTVLVKDINPDLQSSRPYPLRELGGLCLFAATSKQGGRELWASDGTDIGTVLVKDIYPGAIGSNPEHLTVIGGKVFFSADDGVNGRELWVSDGSAAGTMLVQDIFPGSTGSSPLDLFAWNDRLLFAATGADAGSPPTSIGRELFISDGTAAGTVLLGDINPGKAGSYPEFFSIFQGRVWFSAEQSGTGKELWVTDGTPRGTSLFLDIDPGSASSFPKELTPFGTKLLFTASRGASGPMLWITDGSPAGTSQVQSTATVKHTGLLTVVGNLVFFRGTAMGTAGIGHELYLTDGTDSGTVLVKDIFPGRDSYNAPNSGNPAFLTGAGTRLLFSANDGSAGIELWTSDGTTQGTVLLKDIHTPGATLPSMANHLTDVYGNTWFIATDGINSHGFWVTDGTTAGTRRIVDPVPGRSMATLKPGTPDGRFVVHGNTLFFVGNDRTHGAELWKLDLTTEALSMVIDLRPGSSGSEPNELVLWRNRLYFSANDGVHGIELWSSDGTAQGTYLIKDIWPGSGSSAISGLTVHGDRLCFRADDGVHGPEPWCSDGSAAGTFLLGDLRPGAWGSSPSNLISWKGKLYFLADDGVHGEELWCSDGSAAGTSLLKDIWPGSVSSFPGIFCPLGDHLLFEANDGVHGAELWKTDGTAAGTVMVQDNRLGPKSGHALSLTAALGKAVFVAFSDTAGAEPWATDGTAAGTAMIKDLWPGPGYSMVGQFLQNERRFQALGSRLVAFRADDGVHGIEFWISDGTQAGTRMLKDIRPAHFPPFAHAPGYGSAGGKLIFQADDGTKGLELWVWDPGTALAIPFGAPWPGAWQPRGNPDNFPPHDGLYASDPVMGGSMRTTLSGLKPGQAGIVLLDLPARPPLVKMGGFLYLAFFATLPVPLGTPLPIPNDPVLRGANLALQGFVGPTATTPFGIDFTNAVNLYLGP